MYLKTRHWCCGRSIVPVGDSSVIASGVRISTQTAATPIDGRRQFPVILTKQVAMLQTQFSEVRGIAGVILTTLYAIIAAGSEAIGYSCGSAEAHHESTPTTGVSNDTLSEVITTGVEPISRAIDLAGIAAHLNIVSTVCLRRDRGDCAPGTMSKMQPTPLIVG